MVRPSEIAPRYTEEAAGSRPKRARNEVNYAAMMDDKAEEEDDDSVDEHDEEESEEEEEMLEEEEDMEIGKKSKEEKKWSRRKAKDNGSDQEMDEEELARFINQLDEDEETLYNRENQYRLERQAVRRDEIWAAVLEGEDTSNKFQPDDKDLEFKKKFVAFVNAQTKKRNAGAHMISEKNKELMDAGEFLTGMDKSSQAQTAKKYWFGLNRVLGYMQKELNDYSPGLLEDGKMHLHFFFDFHGDNFVKIINIVNVIEKLEPVLSIRPLCLGGYLALTRMVIEELETMPARCKFLDPKIENLRSRMEKAESDADEIQQSTVLKYGVMKGMEMFQKWGQQIRSGAKKTKEYQEQFLDMTMPKSMDIIRKFLTSQELKDIIGKMVYYADKLANNEDVTILDPFIHELNAVVPAVLFCRAGNRPELLGDLRRGQVDTAVPDQANPAKPLHLDDRLKNKPEIKANMRDGMYVNPSPGEKDPNDPEPPQDHPAWKEGWLQGYTIKAELHKTSYKWDLWVFLSKGDFFILKMYLAITGKFLKDKKKAGISCATVTNESPVFVNRSGGRLISDDRPFNLRKLREITGCSKIHPYTFR